MELMKSVHRLRRLLAKRPGAVFRERRLQNFFLLVHFQQLVKVFIFGESCDLEDYATTYRATRDAFLKAANELKLATGPYKAARDAYVAATATYIKSLYE